LNACSSIFFSSGLSSSGNVWRPIMAPASISNYINITPTPETCITASL
jgi:hypothetical protein